MVEDKISPKLVRLVAYLSSFHFCNIPNQNAKLANKSHICKTCKCETYLKKVGRKDLKKL